MTLSTKSKENIKAALMTGLVVILAIQANNYIVNPGIAWVKGKMSKPVTPPVTPP